MEPHIAALGFLAAVFGTGGLIVLCGLGVVLQKPLLAKFAGAVACLVVIAYGALLVAFSAASPERTLALGSEKYFCDLDCHLAYSVQSVEHPQVVGSPPDAVTARGRFSVVMLRVRFDETTISPHRGDSPLYPENVHLAVVDVGGRRYEPRSDAQRALERAQGSTVSFTQPLRPGESFTKAFVFDLPADVRRPRLLLTDPIVVTPFLIDHENSFFHKKTYLRLADGLEGKSASRATLTSGCPCGRHGRT